MTAQDIYHCFDEMRHELVVPFLRMLETPWWLCRALYREYVDLEADAVVLDAPRCGKNAVGKGGVTGRILTPAELKVQFRAALEPFVASWEARGFGIVRWHTNWDFGEERLEKLTCTQLWWANNFWLFAENHKGTIHHAPGFHRRVGRAGYEMDTVVSRLPLQRQCPCPRPTPHSRDPGAER